MTTPSETGSKRLPVQMVAEKLRERIFAQAPGEQLGSLPELAKAFGVGIVTVQQAARVLEHEGLLEVRRGPGGGYYGRRPDLESLERSLASYMRSQPASRREVLDVTSLLFNELCATAARCTDETMIEELHRFAATIASLTDEADIGSLESVLQDILFRMVDLPLFELLTRVALRLAVSQPDPRGGFGLARWQESRRHIIAAILARDPQLARFEANRRNRRVVMELDDPAAG